MRTIRKYATNNIEDRRFTVELNEKFHILHVEKGLMWVEVNLDRPVYPYEFSVVGTGWDVDANLEPHEDSFHVGTWIDGPFTWHLYLVVNK